MTAMSIGASGKVYPCVDAVGTKIAEVGDVRDQDLLSIWRSEAWNLYRGGFEEADLPVCADCQSSNVCGVKKCRAYPAAALDDPYGPKPECLRNFERLGVPKEHVARYKDKLVPLFDGMLE